MTNYPPASRTRSKSLLSGQGYAILWGALSLVSCTLAVTFFLQNKRNETQARLFLEQFNQADGARGDLVTNNKQLLADKQQLENDLKAAQADLATATEQLKAKEASLAENTNQSSAVLQRLKDDEENRRRRAVVNENIANLLRAFTRPEAVTTITRGDSPGLRLSASFLFESDAPPRLRPEAATLLASLASALQPIAATHALRVEDNMDNGAPAPEALERYGSTWSMSATRAALVGQWLLAKSSVKPRLRVSGLADSQPMTTNATEAGRQMNRRLEIYLEPLPTDEPTVNIMSTPAAATPSATPATGGPLAPEINPNAPKPAPAPKPAASSDSSPSKPAAPKPSTAKASSDAPKPKTSTTAKKKNSDEDKPAPKKKKPVQE